MPTSEKPQISEEERLVRHVLEKDGDSTETVNEMRKFDLLDEPVSHYRCVWSSDDYPIIPAWEDIEDEQETYERPPDHIGCLHCGVMTSPDNTAFSPEIWENYKGPRYILSE